MHAHMYVFYLFLLCPCVCVCVCFFYAWNRGTFTLNDWEILMVERKR